MKNWALIIGGSSGIGLATAKLFYLKGYNICIIHRDTRSKKTYLEKVFNEIKTSDNELITYNINATEKENIEFLVQEFKKYIPSNSFFKVVLHSISDGNLNPLISIDNFSSTLSENEFAHTINTMGVSFISWAKTLFNEHLLGKNSRIIGLTSEGSNRAIYGYAAVAAAKSVLESSCKYLAVELANYSITVNLINAGIIATDSLKKICNYEILLKNASSRNPSGRLTQPEDIANVVYLLSLKESSWITGEIIRADGGEQIVHY